MIKQKRLAEILNSLNSIDNVFVVGDIGVDKYTLGDVKRISPEAPVPVLEVHKEWTKLGLAANVSDNLNSLEVKNKLIGVSGDDQHGNELESLLEDSGLSTWGIVRDSSRPTTYKERIVTATQQICRIDYESKDLIQQEVKEKIVKRVSDLGSEANAIILEDYAKGLFDEEFLKSLISKSNELGVISAADPSRLTPPLWYKGVHLLKPNQKEANLMVSALGYNRESKVETIAEILIEKLNLKKLVVTLGADGMALVDTELDGKLKIIPTFSSEVFDVSGAGDTTIAALVSCLCAGASLEESCIVANLAAGVVVGKKGTANVSRDEILIFHQLKNAL